MPLEDGYGVVIGTLHDYFRDPVNDFGQYYHANAIVQTPSGTYECAIDVDSKGLPNGVEWRVVELGKSDMKGVAALPYGWHYLPSNAESGALDYVRSPELRPEPGYFFELSDAFLESLRRLPQAAIYPPWRQGTSRDALADLEPLLEDPKALYTSRSGITPEYREAGAEGSTSFMVYIHAIAAGHLELALYAVSLFMSALPEELLLIRMRGFGRRGFGRGFGSFRILRILFALLFTTLLGPVVLVALIAFAGYAFFNSRRRG